jgi:hypothetical protein
MEYHGDDPLKTIGRLGAFFMLTHWPLGVYRDYRLWRAVMTIEGDSIVGEGTSHEYAVHKCIQKYILRQPKIEGN